jgi:hypothetical protein
MTEEDADSKSSSATAVYSWVRVEITVARWGKAESDTGPFTDPRLATPVQGQISHKTDTTFLIT